MSDHNKDKDFWNKIQEQKIEEEKTFAKNNLTGITAANARTAQIPGGHYKKLHEKVGLDIFGKQEDWEKLGFSEQSAIDVATNTFFGTITNIAGGVVEGIAANDMKGAFDMSFGNTEANYGNILHDFAKGIMEHSENNFHIYDGGNTSPFTKEYWGKQLQSLGYSSGIILEMFGEQALLAAVTRGAGNAATAGRFATQMNKLKRAGSFLAKPSVFGSYQGIKEAYLNGLQTGEETYKKYKDAGYSDEQAKEKSNEAATLGFRMEVLPLMTMNALQFAAIQKYNPFAKGGPATGYSGAFETLADNAFKGVKNKYARKALDYTTQAVGEAIEEGIQTGIGKEAQYQTLLADGLVGEQDLFSRTFEGNEIRDSMLGGALGGVMFRFMGKRFNKLTQGTAVAQYQQEHDKFLTGVAQRINQDTSDLQEAFQSGDQDRVDVVRKRLQRNNVIEALQLDLANQKETAFDAYVSTLEETLEKANSHTPEDMEYLKSQGIDVVGDVEHIRENYPIYIQDALDIKEKLIANLQNNSDVNAAIQLTNHQKTVDELIEFEGRSKAKIEDFRTNNKAYNNLSMEGQKVFNLQNEKVALIIKGQTGSITNAQKERLEEINTELADSNLSAKDKALIVGIPKSSTLIQEELNMLEFQGYQEKLSERIQYWSNPENQKKERVARAKKMVEESNSKTEIEEAQKSLEQEGELTPEVKEAIKTKKEEVEIKETTSPKSQNISFGDVVRNATPSEVAEFSKERNKSHSEMESMFPEQAKEGAKPKDLNDMFAPGEVNNMSPEALAKVKALTTDAYNNLKEDLAKTPTFKDYVRDFINHRGKDSADRLYNVLVEGWKANNYTKADYDAVYRELFRSNKDIFSELSDIGADIIAPMTSQEIKTSNEKTLEKAVEKDAPVLELDDNNRPVLRDTNPFRASEPTLKAAHLSIMYNREFVTEEDGTVTVIDTDASSELNEGQYVDSKKLLDPERFNVGENLVVEVPTNFREIRVTTWEDDFTKGPSMTFGEWERLPGNEKYLKHTNNSSQKADTERRRQEVSREKITKGSRKGQDKVVYKETYQETEEGDVISVTKFSSEIGGTEVTLGGKTMTVKEFKEQYPLTEDYQDILEDLDDNEKITVRAVNRSSKNSRFESTVDVFSPNLGGKARLAIKKDNAKYNAELEVQQVNNENELNPKWLNKVPMIAYDQDGDGVFFIHDTEWYNGVNTGFKTDPKKQSKLITEARKELTDFRSQVLDAGSLTIEITSKRPGTWKQTEDGQTITLNEANPNSELAIMKDNGLMLNGKEVFEKDGRSLINTKDVIDGQEVSKLRRGHTYDIRRSTTKGDYIALEVLREKITGDTVTTLDWAMRIKADRYNKNLTKQRDEVLNATGLDLYDAEDFQKFASQFIQFGNVKFDGGKDFKLVSQNATQHYNNLLVRDKKGNQKNLPKGTPYVFTQNFRIFFGRVGMEMYPGVQTMFIDAKNPASMARFKEILPHFTLNISESGLASNRKTVSFDEAGNVSVGADYKTYLKDNLKTTVRSFNIGTQSKPNYATIIQPVVNFKIADNQLEDYQKGEVKQKTVDAIAEKVATEKPLTTMESAIKQDVAKEVEEKVQEIKKSQALFKGVPIEYTEIINAEGKRGIAQLNRKGENLTIKVDPTLMRKGYENKVWTKPRQLVETLHGEKVNSAAKALPEDQFKSYEEWEQFVLEHEYQHTLYPRKDFQAEFPQGTKGEYETAINNRALEVLYPKDKIVLNEETKLALLDTLQAFRDLGLNESSAEIQAVKEELGQYGDNLFAPGELTEDQVERIAGKLTGIEGLSIIQEFQVIDYIFNQVTSKLDFKYKSSIDKAELLKEVEDSYFTSIKPRKEKNEKILANLKKVYESNKNERLGFMVESLEREMGIFQVIEDNWKTLAKSGLAKVQKYTGIKEVAKQANVSEDGQKEKNYSKTSLEENGKTTSSYRLKRFFAGIKEVKADGKQKTGFLGVPTYVGFDKVYSTLEQIISSPFEVDSDFDLMIARLEDNVANHGWLRQVIDELKGADAQIKNEFVYNFTRHTLSMKFVMFSKNRDDSWTLKVYDTNSGEVTRVIRRQWDSNLKQSPLVYVENGQYKIVKERANLLLEQFQSFKEELELSKKTGKKAKITNKQLREWLGDFGIYLSDETLNELRTKKITYTTNSGKSSMTFPQMFEQSRSTAGVFGLLAHYLDDIRKKDDTEFEENPDNHPFSNANNVLKTLARIESKYAMYATTNSFRDGGKSIYGFTPTKFASDTVKKLKFDPEFRRQLLNKSFNKHSYLLELLEGNEAFQDKFYLDHLGITSIKELGKRVFGDNSITSLSDSDHELVKLGMFQDVEQGEIKAAVGPNKGIGLRMARMFLPTMSDKSQMLDLYTAVLDLKPKHLTTDMKNISNEVAEFLYTQLVSPEVDRIASFHSLENGTNIKDYDLAAQMFLMIPELNNLTHVDPSLKEEKRVISLMANNPTVFNKQWFDDNVKPKALQVVKEFINSEVSAKIESWKDSGFIEKGENGESTIKYLNQKYFKKANAKEFTTDQQIRLAAYDYVVNSINTNANVSMTIAGDIALYSKGSIKKYFQKGSDGKTKPWMPKEDLGDKAYSMAIKHIADVNVGKRLALLIAPGYKLANSKGQQYNQIFINDFTTITSNVTTLVDLFYDKKEAAKAAKLVKDYNNADNTKVRKGIVKQLTDSYPEISDYFDIEATDAQEYTTAKEHIDVLFGQGRLSSLQHTNMLERLERQYQAEKEGKAIPKDALLTHSELKLVLQPIKPVHTGFKEEETMDVMRMMYVKSSSFPLIPQVTKGTHLDKLRKIMEEYEKETGRNVRASYQSANKVGANTNAINAFNTDGTFNEDLTMADLEQGTVILDRDNFRIQQDVPFKSEKKGKDEVSLGTQTLKLLFGDGMLDLEGFTYNGETLSGRELHEKFNNTYNEYISYRRKLLFEELGVDDKGQPLNVKHTMNKIQNLLKREAEDRGYPRQDVEALKVSPKFDSQGNVIDIQFSIPLWLSPNSNRYESLLNAIVSNRLVNIKLPGSSYVAGSEAGFKMQSDMSGINQSNIIFTDKWEGELKAAEFHENGKLKKAQVLLRSQFRDNEGNLIKLINEDGTPNSNFVERGEDGVLRLKEGSIAEELLNITSFRIPTSGHVSMSQLEIVGFLPTEVGDLMVVPRNLTTQKGLDFDIDKETTYHLHTYVNEEGRLVQLQEYISLEEIDEIINDYESLLEGLRQAKEENGELIEEVKAEIAETADIGYVPISKANRLTELKEKTSYRKEEIKSTVKELKGLKKTRQKLLENEIVKVHSSVLSNENKEVQRKINKVLSMDFAKGQAGLIQNLVEGQKDNKYFSMLSDSYQKQKMFLGASGKLGIGVYSNYVVFHSMIQQMEKGKPMQLMERIKNEETGKTEKVGLKVVIGNQVSDGTLGKRNSLAPGKHKRSIAEVFAERQNTATDNEKEQIMGRVNVNEVTINVDSLLSALGFDKDVINKGKTNEKEVSIPYLLLSQPILREFVAEIRKTKSNTTEFDPAAREKVIFELRKKYTPSSKYDPAAQRAMLTGQHLYDNLASTPNNATQTEVLNLFLELDDYGKQISKFQNRLNINRSGLGKSFFETIDKYEAVQSIFADYENNRRGLILKNASGLIGQYVANEDATQNLREALIADGYVEFDRYFIKPNNPVSSMLINSVQTGYNLWKDHFPYNDRGIKSVMNEVLESVSSESTSEQKKIEIKQNIFKEMKKYFVSSSKLGTFQGDIQQERARLFIDSDTNTSLASYLKTVLGDESSRDTLKTNKLISRFEFSINKNGLPSLIKFDNTKGENFDEDYLYVALAELVGSNDKLPDFNGDTNYTTRKLAQDLVAYSYLEGGIQEAVQFVKYIPVSMLETLGFSQNARNWSSKFTPGLFDLMLGKNTEGDYASRFARQYLQHNPQRLPKVEVRQLGEKSYASGSKPEHLTGFELNPEAMTIEEYEAVKDSKFLAIYNPNIKKGLKKFQVYQKMGDRFERISTLGAFGMSEYSIRDNNVKTLINDYWNNPVAEKPVNLKVSKPKSNLMFNIESGNMKNVLESVAQTTFTKFPHLSNLAKTLAPFVGDSLPVEVVNFEEKFGKKNASGVYDKKENKVYINSIWARGKDSEMIAKTIVHEAIHALTANYVGQYIDNNGKLLVENPPKEIMELSLLYNEVVRKLGKDKIDALRNKFGSNIKLDDTERQVTYGGLNVHEFMTFVMTEPEFQKEMMNVTYKQSGKSIMDKLAEIVDSILSKVIGESYNKSGVTAQGIRTTLGIVKNQYTQSKPKTKIEKMEDNDKASEALLNKSVSFGSVVTNVRGFEDTTPPNNPEDLNQFLAPSDFIWKFNENHNINFVVKNGFPFSQDLINKVAAGEQQITIRQPDRYNYEGIYEAGGRKLLVTRISNKPINIKFLTDKGKSIADIEKAFKGIKKEDLKQSSVRDWFDGKGEKNVFFVKDITNTLHSPMENGIFENPFHC